MMIETEAQRKCFFDYYAASSSVSVSPHVLRWYSWSPFGYTSGSSGLLHIQDWELWPAEYIPQCG
jgi:hypothetical protein